MINPDWYLQNIPETAREGILQIMSHRSKLKAEDMIYDVVGIRFYWGWMTFVILLDFAFTKIFLILCMF